MIPRHQQALVLQRLREFPAVALVGPRQAGKTTLAKSLSTIYFDLEQEGDRVQLDLRWPELTQSDQLVVLDEAQAWPEVFPRLRGAIDARRKINGRFLLLGSVSPSLTREVGESLAGRLALVELSPLVAAELPPEYHDNLWRYGGFPDGGVIGGKGAAFPIWQESYIRQMAQRDLPAWGLPAKPAETERLLRLTAAINGSLLNASQLGQGLGVSYHTIQNYLDHLEGAFLIRLLRPFFANNFPKRLLKSPKLYWRDSGLLHSLLGWSPDADLFARPWVGASWEGWVIEQILAVRQARGDSTHAWFFRTSDGLECDLILESGSEREVLEIKLASEPSSGDFRKLEKIAHLVGATRQVMITRIEDPGKMVATGARWSVNLAAYLAQFATLPHLSAVAVTPSAASVPVLLQRISEAAGALRERGIVSNETLLKRAQWLKEDLDALSFDTFRILPTQWIEPPGMGLRIPLVEYEFGKTDHDIENATDPFNVPKDVRLIDGTTLSHGDLRHFGKVSEIGHTIIPTLWLANPKLRERVRLPTQHLDTLNEVWWLSRWQGIESDSVEMEYLARRDKPNLSKKNPSTVDWRFTVLGGQIAINLSVKNRRGTVGSPLFKKGVYLFGDDPDEAFDENSEDEINVLAITAYHGGWITPQQEADLAAKYLDQDLVARNRPVVDAVVLSVVSGSTPTSYDRLYFPTTRSLAKKDLLMKAILKPMDFEDISRVGIVRFPIPLPELLDSIARENSPAR